MINRKTIYFIIKLISITGLIILCLFSVHSCKKDSAPPDSEDTANVVTPPDNTGDSLDPKIADNYSGIANINMSALWGSYNLHDPSIIKHGDYYYIFSTDVAYGPNNRCGIMLRKSKDLVHWHFLGWVFNGQIPPQPLQFMQTNQPGYKQLSLWAPYIIKVGDIFRLYYSVPGNDNLKLACIGLATAQQPEGPWTDEGIVISCLPADPFNAIDPAIIVDQENGRHWMSYGSYEEGIFIVELDPLTGKRSNQSDTGKKIAFRTKRHDAIEGAEILYNPELKKYFLFVSYDWLEDNYNVRVGRSEKPEGPYLDIDGNDMAGIGDNMPGITAQYQFKNHSGWQGIGHCGLLKDGDNYFFVSQGRLGADKYLMNLHVRRMVWLPSGWPVVSPERYVAVPQKSIQLSNIYGKWEQIELTYTHLKNPSIELEFLQNGVISGIENSTWTFTDNILSIQLRNESKIYKALVFQEWDWENNKRTIVYTGISKEGISCWGKKKS